MPKLKNSLRNLVEEVKLLPQEWALCACNGNKAPLGNEWGKAYLKAEDFKKAFHDGIFEKLTIRPDTKPEFHPPSEWCKAIGVQCGEPSGGLLFLDHDGLSCDRYIEELSGLSLKDALPKSPVVTSGRKGRYQVVYQVPDIFWGQIKTTKKRTGETGDDGKPEMLEFRWSGAQSIVLGAHPSTKGYSWVYHPKDLAIAEAPLWMIEQMLIEDQSQKQIRDSISPSIVVSIIECCSEEVRNAISGNYSKPRNDMGIEIALDLLGVANYLTSIGQAFDGYPEQIFFDWCRLVGLDVDMPKGQPEAIWRSANKKNPTPARSAESIEKTINYFTNINKRNLFSESLNGERTYLSSSALSQVEGSPSEVEKLRLEVQVLTQEEDPFKKVFLENNLNKTYKVFGRRLSDLTEALLPKQESEFSYLDKLGANVFAQLEARATSPTVPGFRTGFLELDEITDGLNPGDLIVVAARPSMGKTAFVLGLTRNVAESHDLAVCFFSLEMSKEQLHYRLVSSESGIPSGKLRRGNINKGEFEKISSAIGTLSGLKIGIDDGCALSIEDIEKKVEKFASDNPNLGLIAIDYLQIMESEDNRNLGIAKITRRLKALAKKYNIPVIVLSQLSRAVEQRNDKRPMLSDLRDSGGIEQDADIVMFLYREDYYTPNTPERGMCEVIVAKNRNGPIGTAKLLFEADLVKFHNRLHSSVPQRKVLNERVFDDGYELED